MKFEHWRESATQVSRIRRNGFRWHSCNINPHAVTHRDRPKLPLLVLAAGGILLGAAVLQSLLLTVPGPGASNPHAVKIDVKPPAAAAPKPWEQLDTGPEVELAPAEPDASPTGAVPDAPQRADHAVDPAAPAKPAAAADSPAPQAEPAPAPATASTAATEPPTPEEQPTRDGPASPAGEVSPVAAEPAKPTDIEQNTNTPPAKSTPAPRPEPSQIARTEPEAMSQPAPAPMPAVAPPQVEAPAMEPPPAQSAKLESPAATLEPVTTVPAVHDQAPVEEAKVETLPEEPAAQPEAAHDAADDAAEAKPEVERTPRDPDAGSGGTAAAEAAEDTKSSEPAPEPAKEAKSAEPAPEPVPVAKPVRREEKPAPKSTPAEAPKETAAAPTQGRGLFGRPMSLGFGRGAAKPSAGKVSSGRYAANVRAAIGRHRPRAAGGGSATVAFVIGPGGGLQGAKILRSSGRPAADQAAIATVRAAAPFAPPPPGVKSTFSIRIYFR
jgi:protein TonB